ncbi:MAG: type III secretion system export apparatus subunit SctR [Puniceicoccales bacterium]|jgi:type III secretion protein R|nr:type III secretion system export apparatus subunit SctR [Puniceicoccales bacterium]
MEVVPSTFYNYDPITVILLLTVLGVAPFFLLMVTSFVKLVIVLGLVRNALGTQQVPPNLVLNGLALIITMYIMAPVGKETMAIAAAQEFSIQNVKELPKFLQTVGEPLRNFLMKHTSPSNRGFFLGAAARLWPKKDVENLTASDFLILVPAFTVSELTTSFQIGVLLFLPFIAVDIVVSNVLMALGMMMMSPMTISLPFKLMLFVLVDGWSKLIEGLVLTYT